MVWWFVRRPQHRHGHVFIFCASARHQKGEKLFFLTFSFLWDGCCRIAMFLSFLQSIFCHVLLSFPFSFFLLHRMASFLM